MGYSNFLFLKEELSLIAVMLILLVYDLFGSQKSLKYFHPVACVLFLAHTLLNLFPAGTAEAFGGMYVCTPIGSIVKTILNTGTLIVLLQAYNGVNSESVLIRRGELYLILFSSLLGMYFMISAGNFLLFFIGLETASIPMAVLSAFDKYKHQSAEAGAKYILSATFASGLSLYGISLIYGTVGTLYFADIPAGISGNPLQYMAFGFFIVGLFFKISLVPFHQWTPDVYEGAPTTVTSYFSVISKGSAAFVLMTLLFKVFGNLVTEWQAILYVIIIATITVANLFAIRQQNLKRFLASLVYYILVYMISNLAAFGVIAIIENRTGKITIDDYNGLYSTNPKLSIVMMLALFSLAGIPPFAGFFSKFFIFAAAAEQGFYVLVFIALLNTIISLYYYLLVVKAMFINKTEEAIAPVRSDIYTRLSLIVCTAGILILGLLSTVYEHIGMFSFGITF